MEEPCVAPRGEVPRLDDMEAKGASQGGRCQAAGRGKVNTVGLSY